MADTGSISHREHDAIEHHSHAGRYLIVWIALMAFTLLTYFASRVHLPGGWHVTVALAIATVKGSLVVLFFMHLWDQRGANRLVFVTSLVFVALLVGLTIADNATRFPLSNPPGTRNALPPGGADRDPPPLR
jgi:cytochrome c oxidase subunit IV